MIEEGEWGRRLRLFYHIFYGEGFVVKPSYIYTRQPDSRPFAGESGVICEEEYLDTCLYNVHAGIVWSGVGSINNQQLDAQSQEQREFLVTPGHSMQLLNTSSNTDLIIFSVFPLAS